MIELKNVERSYKTGPTETWCCAASAHHQGRRVCHRHGPSGAGKSSLLNVLALLDDGWLGEYCSAKRRRTSSTASSAPTWLASASAWSSRVITCWTI